MNDMNDIAALSVLQQAQLGEKISYAVARKSNDAAEQSGQAAVSLIEDALQFARESGAMHPTQTVGFIG